MARCVALFTALACLTTMVASQQPAHSDIVVNKFTVNTGLKAGTSKWTLKSTDTANSARLAFWTDFSGIIIAVYPSKATFNVTGWSPSTATAVDVINFDQCKVKTSGDNKKISIACTSSEGRDNKLTIKAKVADPASLPTTVTAGWTLKAIKRTLNGLTNPIPAGTTVTPILAVCTASTGPCFLPRTVTSFPVCRLKGTKAVTCP